MLLRPCRRLAAALLLVLLIGCTPSPQVHSRSFLAFGTLVEVTIAGVDAERADAAMDLLEQDFRYMHETWHAWKPSALSRVNALLRTGEWFSVAPSVRPLIVEAVRLAEASGHRFNPAIGALVELWGFHQDERGNAPPPPEAAIAELVAAAPRMTDLELDGIRMRSRNPAVSLDFGAFAKGYGIDRAIERLRGLGIENAIVNAGGDLRAIGSRGDRPWRIGVRAPRGGGVLAAVEIAGDTSVFTSGDYERNFEYEGEIYHHILDPATGYPARGLTSVTVLARDGATADAAATALFVAGPGAWRQVASDMGLDRVMVVTSDGTVHLTPAMEHEVRFESPRPRVVVETLP